MSNSYSRMPWPKNFWDKCSLNEEGCLVWTGRLDRYGYGVVAVPGAPSMPRLAHRVAFAFAYGREPGPEIDHICHRRDCVHPRHLRECTHSENMKNSVRATRKFCVRGHEWNSDNSYVHNGKRSCRACGRRKSKEYLARKREKKL